METEDALLPLAASDSSDIERLFLAPQETTVLSLLTQILVVEDDAMLANSMIQLLTEDDRVFVHADGIRKAFALLETQQFELVLLDYRLPDGFGLQVMEWLRERQRGEAVIIISGEDSLEAVIGGLRRGACDYLQKPYHPSQLCRAVDNALQKQQLARSNEAMRRQLEHADRLHRQVVENSPDLIYTLDPDGHFNYVNQRVESLLGYARESLLGRHFSVLLCEEDTPQLGRIVHERRTGPRASGNIELRLRRSQAEIALDDPADQPYVTVVLNSTGMYADELEGRARFLGSYGVARDITDRKRAEEMIAYQAYHDHLTQLPNRSLFHDRLELAVAQAQRREALLAVMFLDLDRFKLVNDSFGHPEGDALLRQFSARIKRCLRKGDTLARQGGDEFTILLPDLASQADAGVIAEKIFAELRPVFTIGGSEFRATCSLGIAVFPRDGQTADDLIRHADMAMYAVKTRGKNHFTFFNPAMDAAHVERVAVERELLRAIDHGELFLEYQPKFSYSRRRIVGVEALVRWRHPLRGTVLPGEFIGIAEESGLIHMISDWVLERACAQLAEWQKTAHGLQLSLNLSARDFEREDMVSRICATATQHGLRDGTLEIEITENSLLHNADVVSGQIQQLRERGIKVSIDDFGTGYSSLAYLLKLPVNSLKIDRGFVQELAVDRHHHPIVSAIAGVAQGFGLHVVAEGVETAEQAIALHAIGCDEMQGYYFGHPTGAEQISGQLSALH